MEEVVPASVTVLELDQLVQRIFTKRQEIKTKEAEIALLNKELTLLKNTAIAYLKELKREGYASPVGSVSVQEEFKVKLPPTPEAKAQLFNWLKSLGIFEQYATINYNSLNSLYSAEREAAAKRGEFFQMPGVEEPKLFEKLGVRSANKGDDSNDE